jgi:hypothetical protein
MTAASRAVAATFGGTRSQLTRLADAAAALAGPNDGEVLVVRGLGTAGINRAASMSVKLGRRRLRAQVLGPPPEVLEAAHRTEPTISLVIDLSSSGLGDADLLAAHLSVPLLTVDDEYSFLPGEEATVVERTAAAMAISSSDSNDVALAQATISPFGVEPSAMVVHIDHQLIRLANPVIRVRLRHSFLEVDASADLSMRHFRGPRCRLEPVAGQFIITLDGARKAELNGPLQVDVRTRRYTANLHHP